jgi:hypothetical protein
VPDARSLTLPAASATAFGSRAWVGRSLLLLIACYGSGRIGLVMPLADGNIGLIWPPAASRSRRCCASARLLASVALGSFACTIAAGYPAWGPR